MKEPKYCLQTLPGRCVDGEGWFTQEHTCLKFENHVWSGCLCQCGKRWEAGSTKTRKAPKRRPWSYREFKEREAEGDPTTQDDHPKF